jgi:formylglycine-generating enzyme required for sulfatase activity
MVRIPGGRFLMGRNGVDNSSPAHEVTVPAFFMDRVPVTVGAYRAFAIPRHIPLPEPQTEPADVPVTGITWDEAHNYCSAQRKRLPTEAEWEFATRGSTGTLYPWGEKFIKEAVNSLDTGKGRKESVAFRPRNQSSFGVADLSGNVWQWCQDDYKPYDEGRADFPIPPGAKVIRGGSYRADRSQVSAIARNLELPATRSPVIGFRCAE